jgi:hypothetical protein
MCRPTGVVSGPPDRCTWALVRFARKSFPFGPVRITQLPGVCSSFAVDFDRRMSDYTRRHLTISISSRALSILLIGLAAMTLFAVGPLAGSFDNDGDGAPDIPVVVSDPLLPDVAGAVKADQLSSTVRHPAPSCHLGSSTPGTAPVTNFQVLVVNKVAFPQSCCALRC